MPEPTEAQQPWTRVCWETTPGVGATVTIQDIGFEQFWKHFLDPATRHELRRWYPIPPPDKATIQAEMLDNAFRPLNEEHFLLGSPRARQSMSQIAGQPVTEEDVLHALRPNHTSKLNTNRSFTEEEYKEIPGLLTSNLIRRGRAGLGSQYKAIANTHQFLAQ